MSRKGKHNHQQDGLKTGSPVQIKEYSTHTPKQLSHTYTLRDNSLQSIQPSAAAKPSPSTASSSVVSSTVRFLSSLFLPVDYPSSVTPDYLSFQCWDTIQAVSSYLRGLLCTQAILTGLGVGNSDATAASATMNWIVRDGVGMFGGMLFAWWGAEGFGRNIKQYRLFADLINDVGLTLELLSPIFPEYFLFIACIGTLCRALCGVAAGATRAGLMAHFALNNNISDISAKEGIQETAVTLLGLCCGSAAVQWLDGHTARTWLLFIVLTFVHIMANVQAMQCLVLRTLDHQRATIVLTHFLTHRQVLNTRQCAAREKLLYTSNRDGITLGAKLTQLQIQSLTTAIDTAEQISAETHFLLVPSTASHSSPPPVAVLLTPDIQPKRLLSALFHALLYQHIVQDMHDTAGADTESGPAEQPSHLIKCLSEGEIMFDLLWDDLCKERHTGWKLDNIQLQTQPWRYTWTFKHR